MMSKKLTISISQGTKSKSVSYLKSPLFSGKSSSFTASPINKKSVNSLFQELQMTKCENLKEINARKQKENILFHKLMTSLKNSETKDFVMLEEKYQDKKKELEKNFEEKAGKLREKILTAKEERENIRSGIEVEGISGLIKGLAENLVTEDTSEGFAKDVIGIQLYGELNLIHSQIANLVDKKPSSVSYKAIIQRVAKSIVDLQQKSKELERKCKERIKYRENLQKSLKSNTSN